MISQKAVVETEKIGKGVTISEFCIVRKRVTIGNRTTIHPNVVIEANVVIGDNVEIFPGTYIGKKPYGAGAITREPSFSKCLRIGDGCAIGPNAVIYYDVDIGKNTLIGDGASIREQCRIGSRSVISRYVTVNYNSKIGDRTKIMDLTHITGNCVVGNDVFVGMLVSTANDNDLKARKYVENSTVGPTICDNATIGTGATVLPGKTVGEGAVVGAHALVTKNVSAKKLVVGLPAKIVRDLTS